MITFLCYSLNSRNQRDKVASNSTFIMVSDQSLILHKVFRLLLPFKGKIIPFTGVTKCKHPQNSEKKI